MRGRLIFFTGLDGSGKTTQAQLYLERERASAPDWVYRWVRWEPWLTRPLMALARRALQRGSPVGNARPSDDTGHGQFRDRKRSVFRRRWLRQLWTVVVLCEYLPQMAWRLLPSLLQGKTVLCDRYLPDVCVDLVMNYGEGTEGLARLLRHPLSRLFPRPDLTLLFDVNPAVGFDRKRDGTPLAYLEDRVPLYRSFPQHLQTVVVDANADLESVQAQVREILGSPERSVGESKQL